MKYILSLVLPIILFGCSNDHSADKTKLNSFEDSILHQNNVVISHNDDFVDILLQISSIDKKDTAQLIHINSNYNGTEVGFDVLLPDNAKKTGFGHGMILSSVGSKSDNFLKMLATEYKIKIDSTSKFCNGDTIAFADLDQMMKNNENAVGPNLSGNKMKLFFEKAGKTEDDGVYAEVYLNMDFSRKTVDFNEKDPEYRSALIDFLTEKKK